MSPLSVLPLIDKVATIFLPLETPRVDESFSDRNSHSLYLSQNRYVGAAPCGCPYSSANEFCNP